MSGVEEEQQLGEVKVVGGGAGGGEIVGRVGGVVLIINHVYSF